MDGISIHEVSVVILILYYRYKSLRHVPAYDRFIKERFQRCLDLYLAPRVRKNRVRMQLLCYHDSRILILFLIAQCRSRFASSKTPKSQRSSTFPYTSSTFIRRPHCSYSLFVNSSIRSLRSLWFR